VDERDLLNSSPLFQRRQAPQPLIEEPRRIHLFVDRQIRSELGDRLAHLAQGAGWVLAALMVERYREVNNGLQEQLSRTGLLQPNVFEDLVTLVKLPGVEARDALFETSLHARFMVAVLSWLKFGRKTDPAPLTGAPVKPRLKTYSAESGYVYQYVFAGQRKAERGRQQGTEYAFDVSYDRKTHHRIWVFVADASLTPWTQANERTLTNSERYGVAKIALRNAFDNRAPERIHEPIAPGADEVRTILDELGV
jgi:hypothetical protein